MTEYVKLAQENCKELTDRHFPDATLTVLKTLSPNDDKDVSNADK